METADKVRENKLRRLAARRGLKIEKFKVRDKAALTYGRFMIEDDTFYVAGVFTTNDHRHVVIGITLEEAEEFITKYRAGQPLPKIDFVDPRSDRARIEGYIPKPDVSGDSADLLKSAEDRAKLADVIKSAEDRAERERQAKLAEERAELARQKQELLDAEIERKAHEEQRANNPKWGSF